MSANRKRRAPTQIDGYSAQRPQNEELYAVGSRLVAVITFSVCFIVSPSTTLLASTFNADNYHFTLNNSLVAANTVNLSPHQRQ